MYDERKRNGELATAKRMGREEERAKVVVKMHSKGLDAKAISDMLEIDIAEVEKILST